MPTVRTKAGTVSTARTTPAPGHWAKTPTQTADKVSSSSAVANEKAAWLTGGVTPGDAYVWTQGADGMPSTLQMWVSIIPVGGVAATWEEWMTLPTGAKVATKHMFMTREMRMTEVGGAATLAELEPGPDPFAALMEPAK